MLDTAEKETLSRGPSKRLQWVKLWQIREALVESGFKTLDEQATALGLGRSTTWSILRGKHKNSGLSTAVILRMLARPELPPRVRQRLSEYIEEKVAGLYGDSPFRVRQFKERLGDARQGSNWPPGHGQAQADSAAPVARTCDSGCH